VPERAIGSNVTLKSDTSADDTGFCQQFEIGFQLVTLAHLLNVLQYLGKGLLV
jgi:hypothetical protein